MNICVVLKGLYEDFVILIIYHSPHSSTVNNMNLLQLMKEFVSIKGKKFIIGDFNVPNVDWIFMYPGAGIKSFENKLISCIHDCFLVQHVKQPTRYKDLQKQNILDLLLTQDDLIYDISFDVPIGKSDHIVIGFLCKFRNSYADVTNKLDFSKGNYN